MKQKRSRGHGMENAMSDFEGNKTKRRDTGFRFIASCMSMPGQRSHCFILVILIFER